MAPKLNFPAAHAIVSLNFGGAGMPNGATATFGIVANTDTDDPLTIATLVKNTLRAAGGPFGSGPAAHASSTTLKNVHVKFGPAATGPEAEVGDGAGLSAGLEAAVPPNTAYLVIKNTNSGGKRGRGRMFIPGLQEGQVNSDGTIIAGTLSILQASWAQFEAQMTTAGHSLALLHNYDSAKGQAPQVPSTVLSLSVSSLLATQRNRMRR